MTVMRRLLLALSLVAGLHLPISGLKAQPAPNSMLDFTHALARFGLTYQVASRAMLQGMTNLVVELAKTDAALAARLHASGNIPNLIHEVIQHNPQFRAAVIARLRGIQGGGVAARRVLSNRNTWRGLRAGSADFRIVAVVATAVVSGTIGYAVGVRLVRTKRQWDQQQLNTQKNERYAHLVQRMLRQVKHGSASLCGGMKYYEAAQRIQINMHTSPDTPFAGVLCRNGQKSCKVSPVKAALVPKSRFRVCGAPSVVHTSCIVTLCRTRAEVEKWIREKRPDMNIKETLACGGNRTEGCPSGYREIANDGGSKACVRCPTGRYNKTTGCCR